MSNPSLGHQIQPLHYMYNKTHGRGCDISYACAPTRSCCPARLFFYVFMSALAPPPPRPTSSRSSVLAAPASSTRPIARSGARGYGILKVGDDRAEA
jgi:hypothetical protein